jgi:hypothetical protein
MFHVEHRFFGPKTKIFLDTRQTKRKDDQANA